MAATMLAEPVQAVPDDQPQLSYEQARDELLEVVNRLESGVESLADSMELFKRGEYLATLCERYLSSARVQIAEARNPMC